jgi:D-3-phosphoglycerate dehydrogenase
VNVSVAIAEQVRDYLLNGIVGNAVNVPSISRELYSQIRPYVRLGEKLGRFQGQLCAGSIEQIEIEYTGDAAGIEVAPITVAVLKGLLESITDQVNMVNAPVLAQQHGIKVVESKSNRPQDFASAITTRVTGCENRLIEGAIFHGGQPRIVRVDDFMLEAIPEGPTLFILNHDHPGVVGTVGAALGEAGINISRMQLGLVPERQEAAMLVNIDRVPAAGVLESLRKIPNLITVQLVDLGA